MNILLCQEMECLRIVFSIGILTLLSACSEKVDEATLENIEARLSAIENIDARITSSSKEKTLVEIELREVQEAIERIEAKQLEEISRVQEELDLTRFEAEGSMVDIESFLNDVREIAEENTKLKEELERLKSKSKD